MPRPLSLSFDLLRTFQLLAHHEGDAAEAARGLGINQASMSKRLKNLQHAGPLLDHPWIEREGKTWRLTDEGRRVLPAVEEILARYEELTRFVGQPFENRIKFACGQQAVQGFVRRAIGNFRERFPTVRLHVATLPGTARIEGVASGTLDLATVTHDEPDIHNIARRKLHVEVLFEDHLVLAAADNAQWRSEIAKLSKTAVRADRLTEFPLIIPGPNSGVRRWLDGILRDQGVLGSLNVVLETGGWATILAYVQDGFGIGIVPDRAAKLARGIILRRLDRAVFPPRVTRLICRKTDGAARKLDLSPEADAFREALVDASR